VVEGVFSGARRLWRFHYRGHALAPDAPASFFAGGSVRVTSLAPGGAPKKSAGFASLDDWMQRGTGAASSSSGMRVAAMQLPDGGAPPADGATAVAPAEAAAMSCLAASYAGCPPSAPDAVADDLAPGEALMPAAADAGAPGCGTPTSHSLPMSIHSTVAGEVAEGGGRTGCPRATRTAPRGSSRRGRSGAAP